MKQLKLMILLIAVVMGSNGIMLAQQTGSQRLDGVYEKLTDQRRPIPYDHIREADVFYAKRIWRLIDTDEKMNKPFLYPKEPFIQILRDAVLSERITVFDDEEFKKPLTAQQVGEIGAGYDTINTYDQYGQVTGTKVVKNEFNPELVKRFRIKEDWFFDEETSTMQVRIIGIAPLLEDPDAGDIPMFWAYYPDLRPILAEKAVFNPLNDAVFMTWEDLFSMRLFSSVIIKESNVYDRRIQDYATGIDALWEAERIKNDIFKYEHDLWSY